MLRTLRIRKTRQSPPDLPSPSEKVKERDPVAPEPTPIDKKSIEKEKPESKLQENFEPEECITPVKRATATNQIRMTAPLEAQKAPAIILIAGGGIVGLVLALAIRKHVGVKAEIYEQAHGFDPDVGAGMGLYANGLRVLRDIDPDLLREIQANGYPYVYRRWERHDGTSVVEAQENVLSSEEGDGNQDNALHTMGIRRWKLQQLLHQAVSKAGIPVYFNKKVLSVTTPDNGMTEIAFTDGTKRQTLLLLGADGGRSTIRSSLLQKAFEKNSSNGKKTEKMPALEYTGVTCVMGVAENMNCRRGISLPVSPTTRCHGAFYPTGEDEQCFQFHFDMPAKKKDGTSNDTCADSCWGNLSQKVSQQECSKLAEILEADGWDEEHYLTPLRNVTKAVRVGFCRLTPQLEEWSFPNSKGQRRTILVGDAAHPPVPYLGQGAQQGMEDAGTLALLFEKFCLDDQGQLDLTNLDHAVKVYESIRIPRVTEVLKNCHFMGDMQLKRAHNPAYNVIKEEMIQRDVFFHETIPIMFPGARYDYRSELEKVLEQQAKDHTGPPMPTISESPFC